MKFTITQPPLTIYIDNNDTLVVLKRNKVLWSIACSDVTDIVSKLKGFQKQKRDVTLSTTHGEKTLKNIDAEAYKVFLTFFSTLGSKKTSKEVTRWYHTSSDTIHVEEYTNVRLMEREISEAGKLGWKIEALSATPGHTTGSISSHHMTQSFRSKDKQTVVFKR